MEREEILRKINAVQWYHRFEILPGLFTPGRIPMDPKGFFAHLGLPADMTGMRVLEIGAWDGPVAFECESRGATLTVLDIQDPSKTGFNTAKEILGSKAEYIVGSVYEAPALLGSTFDYVIFMGVFYHLKHPIMAFEQINKVLGEGGILVYEGECLRSYAEDSKGKPYRDKHIKELALSSLPLCLFYADTFRCDDTNWFIPNATCLREWLRAAGFETVKEVFHDLPPQQRTGGVARKICGLRVEHRLVE